MIRRGLSTATRLFSHENPLGLPRKGTPPRLESRRGLPEKRSIRGVDRVVAVSSAKGGVGKSTVAANTALALARQGLRIGLLDADVYGPSVPSLFGLLGEEPRTTDDGALVPLTNYGVKTMSLGYLVAEAQPVAWRGLLVDRAMRQLLHSVEWGGLDLLLLDLPPGTGDVQLAVTQQVHLDGALLVSTASALALADTLRGRALFDKTDVKTLGVVLNMAAHQCSACGHIDHVFGPDARRTFDAERLDLLGEVPLDAKICSSGDAGRPCVVADPEGPGATIFTDVAAKLGVKLGL